MDQTKPTMLDRAIGYMSPKWAAERSAWRDYQSSYRGAMNTRLDSGWTNNRYVTGQTSSDIHSLQQLRARSKRVDRVNPIGNGMLNRLVDNVVGEGMTLQAKTGKKGDDDFDREAEAKWNEWWIDKADVRGLMSGPDLERQIYRSHERDGDVGIVLVNNGGKSQIQIIDADRIQSPDGRHNQSIIDGVEITPAGRPRAFHVLDAPEMGKRTTTRKLAKDFIYYPRLRANDAVRGEPCFSQVFPLLDQIDGYVDAVVIAARMAAVFGLVFKEAHASKAYGGLPSLTNSQGDQQKGVTLENGSVRYIGPEDDMVQVNPQQPMSQTPDFIKALLRIAGLPLDMPLELVLLDFSQVNFSSARASFLQFYRAMRAKQGTQKRRVMRRIYQWWISREVKAGNFVSAVPERFFAHEFMARGWQWVDPVKEGQAALLEMTMGVNTGRNVASALGRDYDEIQLELAAEAAARRAVDLPSVLSNMTRDKFDVSGQIIATPDDGEVMDDDETQDDDEPTQTDDGDGDTSKDTGNIKTEADAYGVAVRAGAITPQQDDEAHFRDKMGLPSLSADAQRAWKQDEGTRRPITITPSGEDGSTNGQSTQTDNEDGQANQDD